MFRFHLPILFLFAAATPASLAVLSLSSTTTPPRVEVEHRGVVHSWRLDSDGKVYFRLDTVATAKVPSRQLWFVTPASQNSTTEFERLLLPAILSLQEQRRDRDEEPLVLVRADASQDRGSKPAEALEILSISRE